jgi:hypothetical protein
MESFRLALPQVGPHVPLGAVVPQGHTPPEARRPRAIERALSARLENSHLATTGEAATVIDTAAVANGILQPVPSPVMLVVHSVKVENSKVRQAIGASVVSGITAQPARIKRLCQTPAATAAALAVPLESTLQAPMLRRAQPSARPVLRATVKSNHRLPPKTGCVKNVMAEPTTRTKSVNRHARLLQPALLESTSWRVPPRPRTAIVMVSARPVVLSNMFRLPVEEPSRQSVANAMLHAPPVETLQRHPASHVPEHLC